MDKYEQDTDEKQRFLDTLIADRSRDLQRLQGSYISAPTRDDAYSSLRIDRAVQ